MADISALLASSGRTQADFNAIPGIADSYFAGLDQRQKRLQRDVFSEGLPTNPDGSPNYGEAAKRLYQIGDVQGGNTMSNLDIQRQQLQLGQEASRAMGGLESGSGRPPLNVPTVAPGNLPPSPNRSGATPVAPALTGPQSRTDQPAVQPSVQPAGKAQNLYEIVAATGIPNADLEQATTSIARQIGIDDPRQPVNLNDPQVRNVLVPAIQQLKRRPAPQVVSSEMTQGAPVAAPVAAPAVTDTRGNAPTSIDPNIQARASQYIQIMSNPALPQSVRDAAKMRLEALQRNSDLTGTQKEYEQAVRQGYRGTLQDFMSDTEAKKTAATEDAKVNIKKYETLVDNGVKAQQEIPQLEMLQQMMNDPNFFSGAGEKYNLLYKRLKAAVGIDPEAAVPQEYLRKATAANVLGSLGALKGLGQIRVSEINMAREAAAAPDNSIPANKLLVEISKRTHERNAQIAEKAQAYKQKNGTLDAGFDQEVTDFYKKHPLFSDAEIKDWHKAIGEAKASTAPQQPARGGSGGQMRFASPGDVHAAVAAGKLKKGDTFFDANGTPRIVP